MNPALQEETKRAKSKLVISHKYRLLLYASPFILLILVFSYFPLYGWTYAFYNYRVGFSLSDSEFVGFKWFLSIINNEYQMAEVARVMKNTFAISTLGLLTSILPVIFAVLLVEIKTTWYKKLVQTLTTLPNFISWVLVYAIAFMLFSYDNGLINKLMVSLGFQDSNVNYLASNEYIWIKMTLWNVWKTLGWGAILYIAAIMGIDQELYEAARVDGAGRVRLMWHITLPGVMPTFFVLLLLSIANFINNGMEQYFVFQNAINKDSIEVLDLYVYNTGLVGYNFSFATAVSMLKSIVSVFLLFVANQCSKWVRGESII